MWVAPTEVALRMPRPGGVPDGGSTSWVAPPAHLPQGREALPVKGGIGAVVYRRAGRGQNDSQDDHQKQDALASRQ